MNRDLKRVRIQTVDGQLVGGTMVRPSDLELCKSYLSTHMSDGETLVIEDFTPPSWESNYEVRQYVTDRKTLNILNK